MKGDSLDEMRFRFFNHLIDEVLLIMNDEVGLVHTKTLVGENNYEITSLNMKGYIMGKTSIRIEDDVDALYLFGMTQGFWLGSTINRLQDKIVKRVWDEFGDYRREDIYRQSGYVPVLMPT